MPVTVDSTWSYGSFRTSGVRSLTSFPVSVRSRDPVLVWTTPLSFLGHTGSSRLPFPPPHPSPSLVTSPSVAPPSHLSPAPVRRVPGDPTDLR